MTVLAAAAPGACIDMRDQRFPIQYAHCGMPASQESCMHAALLLVSSESVSCLKHAVSSAHVPAMPKQYVGSHSSGLQPLQ